MAELADAPDLGSGVHDVGVRVPFPARKKEQQEGIPSCCSFFCSFLRTSTSVCIYSTRIKLLHLFKEGIVHANTTRINEKQERDIGNDGDGITGHSEKKNLA